MTREYLVFSHTLALFMPSSSNPLKEKDSARHSDISLCVYVILELGRQRQEDVCEFHSSLDLDRLIARPKRTT